MRSIITVVGKDTVGILAKVSSLCAEKNANVLEVTQSILSDMFCMIMLVDISELSIGFAEFSVAMENLGVENSLRISAVHEDIFNSIHRI